MGMTTIEVDASTARSIRFAAHLWGVSEGEVVRRMVQRLEAEASAGSSATALPGRVASKPSTVPSGGTGTTDPRIETWMDYAGQRTEALFDAATHELEIVSGPLRGRTFGSPSGACSAVKLHYRPEQIGSCNGWVTWRVAGGATLDKHR